MARHVFPCIDAHTCGNPVRVVIDNKPELAGASMVERRAYFLEHFDWIRTGLMFEPRGHDAMSGSIIYPPINPGSDMAVLFIEVSGCLPMCGHGTIGTVTVAIEHGLVEPAQPGRLVMDTPAGTVTATYTMDGDFVESVTITNIESFLHSRDVEVAVDGIGQLTLDVSYGGNFYAIVEPQPDYPGLDAISVDDIRRWSPRVRQAVNDTGEFVHPIHDAIRGVSHVMWTDRPRAEGADARNAVFYGERGIDRSPCGTGTSARMAQLVARGKLAIGKHFVHESIIGSLFDGCPVRHADLAGRDAIIPTISAWARVTGENTISIDDRDPYAHGFLLA